MRNRLNDLLTHLEEGEHEEYNALNKDDGKTYLEACNVTANHRSDAGNDRCKVGVQTHTGCERKRHICQKAHQNGGDACGKNRCKEHCIPKSWPMQRRFNRVPKRTEVCEEVRVQRNDVGHRQEGGNTGHDLGLQRRTAFLYLKETQNLFHNRKSSPFKIFCRSAKARASKRKAAKDREKNTVFARN